MSISSKHTSSHAEVSCSMDLSYSSKVILDRNMTNVPKHLDSTHALVHTQNVKIKSESTLIYQYNRRQHHTHICSMTRMLLHTQNEKNKVGINAAATFILM